MISEIKFNRMSWLRADSKRVLLIESADSEGEEAFHIYLVFPDDTRDEDLAWNKIEPMVSWVRNFVWERTRFPPSSMARISHDLLAQARILATREPRRPKQATLRRSVSTCYYALFHFLIEEATLLLVGAAHADVRLRQLAARAFVHGKMKSLCKEFVKTNPQAVHELLRPFWSGFNVATNQQIRAVAQTFIDLQDERHDADYNVSIMLSRQDALNAFTRAQTAFSDWRQVKTANRELCRLFSLTLSLWPSLASR